MRRATHNNKLQQIPPPHRPASYRSYMANKAYPPQYAQTSQPAGTPPAPQVQLPWRSHLSRKLRLQHSTGRQLSSPPGTVANTGSYALEILTPRRQGRRGAGGEEGNHITTSSNKYHHHHHPILLPATGPICSIRPIPHRSTHLPTGRRNSRSEASTPASAACPFQPAGASPLLPA